MKESGCDGGGGCLRWSLFWRWVGAMASNTGAGVRGGAQGVMKADWEDGDEGREQADGLHALAGFLSTTLVSGLASNVPFLHINPSPSCYRRGAKSIDDVPSLFRTLPSLISTAPRG